jgi:hypothetical protein
LIADFRIRSGAGRGKAAGIGVIPFRPKAASGQRAGIAFLNGRFGSMLSNKAFCIIGLKL